MGEAITQFGNTALRPQQEIIHMLLGSIAEHSGRALAKFSPARRQNQAMR